MISTRQETSSTHPVDLFKAAAMTHSWSTVALRRQRLIHDGWRPPAGQYEHVVVAFADRRPRLASFTGLAVALRISARVGAQP